MKSECKTPEKCRIVHNGGTSTLMWSPIEYDGNGNPVSGGGNRMNSTKSCNTCGKMWSQSATELEIAQGKAEWVEIKPS